MRMSNPHCPNFLDKNNPDFKQVHSTLDVHFCRLLEIGLGRNVKHAEVVTKGAEGKLWSQNVMSTTTPRSLLNVVFYLNGKELLSSWSRGASQFEDLPAAATFTDGFTMRTAQRIVPAHSSISTSIVPIYCTCVVDSECCHVHILDLYITKIPQKVL